MKARQNDRTAVGSGIRRSPRRAAVIVHARIEPSFNRQEARDVGNSGTEPSIGGIRIVALKRQTEQSVFLMSRKITPVPCASRPVVFRGFQRVGSALRDAS
jgi:hypothetical protein